MKLGEAMYKAQGGDPGMGPDGAGAGPGGGGAGETPKDDNVVDADFEEVDEKKRKGSA
jgi:molecular chaperone DnaK